ncbi:MAG: hypothetical protein ACRDE5_06190, partial [Ginsengibacter sp.]
SIAAGISWAWASSIKIRYMCSQDINIEIKKLQDLLFSPKGVCVSINPAMWYPKVQIQVYNDFQSKNQ